MAIPVLHIRMAVVIVTAWPGVLMVPPDTMDFVKTKLEGGGVGMAVSWKVSRKYRLSHWALWSPEAVSDRTGTMRPVRAS